MKRSFRMEGSEMDMHSINMANVLMLLSRGSKDHEIDHQHTMAPGRVYECKTCSRQFPSFQALGGHRASHKKPRLTTSSGDQNQSQADQGAVAKPRAHECSICGVEFAIGQALGGHMRRHRATGTEGFAVHGVVEKKSNGKRVMLLDLNSPPSDDDMECRKLELGLGLGLGLVCT